MIDPKLKEAWQWTKQYSEGYAVTLANAYLNAEAGRRMAEFQRQHYKISIKACAICRLNFDPRHSWGLAEWRAELERKLNT